MTSKQILGLLITLFFTSTIGLNCSQANDILIHAGAVLSIPGQAPYGPSTILVRDGRISQVREGFADAKAFALEHQSVRLLDLRTSFVLPGLMDTHVHLTSANEPDADGHVTLTSADLTLRALNNARANLAARYF